MISSEIVAPRARCETVPDPPEAGCAHREFPRSRWTGEKLHPEPAPSGTQYSSPPVSYYVTTPIYYVNAEPHLGHAYTVIAVDVLARHMRERGEDVFLLTGTDEHGEPVAQAAEKLGISPSELADRNAPRFKELMPKVNASNDFFIRTTDPQHEAKVQEIVQRVHDNGHVYEGIYEGWYCPRCADFKTESELGEGNTCPIHKIELSREREENWFFRLSTFQEPLERLYAGKAGFRQPAGAPKRGALVHPPGARQDVSLSRPKLTWGVPLPWDQSQVIYVWFDALLNYVTALGYAREGEDLTERFWPAFHVIGKDILKFHTVYWPAFLMAAGYEVPRGMFVHGFLLMEGHKMSKSLGNVLDPFEVIERFGADAASLLLPAREVSFGRTARSRRPASKPATRPSLANDSGNLASRTLAMVNRYRDGVVPDAQPDPELAGGADGLQGVEARVASLLDRTELTQALEEIWVRVRRLNRYVEETRPWDLAKDDGQAARLDQVLYSLCEGVRVLALLLCAYMPETSGRLLDALGEARAQAGPFGSRGGGQSTRRSSRRCSRRSRRGSLSGPTRPAPRLAAVVDTHAHLSACEPEAASWSTARAGGGPTHPHCGDGRRLQPRGDRRRRGAHQEVFAGVGRHPNAAAGFDRRAAAQIEALAAGERVVAVGETGLDYYRDRTPRAEQRAAFEAQIAIARRIGLPVVIHMRDPVDSDEAVSETFATLAAEAEGVTVVLHCCSGPTRAHPRGRRARLVLLVRRQRHLPQGRWAPRGGARCSRRAAAGRDGLALPGAAVRARQAQRARERGRGRRAARRGARHRVRGAGSARGCERGEGIRVVRLGQNFLADTNLLDAIVRDAGLGSGEVVLEVGAGEGALSDRLAPRVAHLHVIELDQRLAGRWRRCPPRTRISRSSGATRCGSTFGRSSRHRRRWCRTSRTRSPRRSCGRQSPSCRRSRRGLCWSSERSPTVCGQRPGSRTYGAPSVLVQLACEVELLRTVDRAVFRPRPRVDSALVRLTRRAPPAPPAPALAGFVRDAFAHRRKPMAGSLELAGGPPREAVRGALRDLGLDGDARAEALAPADFVELAERLGVH